MRLVLILFLCLLSGQAWAATPVCDGTAVSGCQYVGQASTCTNNGDGTISTCAATSNGAGRRRGWSNINWGAMGADTVLCLVGDDTETIRLNIQASGAAGQYLKITGDCAGQTTKPVLKTTGSSALIDGTDDGYIWLDFFEIQGGAAANIQQIRFEATTANRAGIKMTRLKVSNALSTAAAPSHCIYLHANATYSHSDVIIQNTEVFNCGAGNTTNSDGINIESVSSGLLIEDIDAHDNYYNGIDISRGGTSPILRRIHSYRNGMGGVKTHCINGSSTGGLITALLSHDNGQWALEFDDWPNTTVANNTLIGASAAPAIKPGSSVFGSIRVSNDNPGTCTQTGNSFYNNLMTADYQAGVFRIYDGTLSDWTNPGVGNNTFNGNLMWQRGSQTPLIYLPNDLANNVTAANFRTWQESHLLDQNVEPKMVGGQSPSTVSGFRLSGASTLRRAGVELNLGNVQDYGNRAFAHPPSIGAWEVASGDLAASRTTRD